MSTELAQDTENVIDAVVAQTDGDAPKTSPETEREARAMGWVPETEWKGDAPRGGFKSADEFVQRGKEVLPLVNKRLKEELASATDKLEKLERETADKIARISRMSDTALKNQRKDLEAKFEALKEAAVEVGDKAAYREADKASRDALSDFDKAAAETTEDGKDKKDKFEVPPAIKATVDGWIAENAWMKSDPELNAVANARHEKLLKEKPGLSLAENLAEVRKYVEKKYPEKFGIDDDETEEDPGDDQPKRRGSPVESGSRAPSGSKGSAFAKLPKEAQTQADKFIKDDGLFLEKGETVEKDLAKARERYAQSYLED